MCFVAKDLSELSQNPQFPAFRQLIQTLRQLIQNPDQLQILMQTLQRISAGTGPVNRYRSGRTGQDRFRRSTGPEKTGNSPVESFEKSPSFVLFSAVKSNMSHIFLSKFLKMCSKHMLF